MFKPYVEVAGRESQQLVFTFERCVCGSVPPPSGWPGPEAFWGLTDAYLAAPEQDPRVAELTLSCLGDEPRRVTFRVDVDAGALSPTMGPSLPPYEQAVARALLEQGGDRLWRQLERRRQLVRAWGLTRVEGPPVPRHNRCKHLLMEFAPREEPFALPFMHRGALWHVLDAQCVAPTCRCGDVVLSFFRPAPSKRGRLQLERFSISFTPCWIREATTGRRLTRREDQLLDAFLGEVGDWELMLRRRFAFVRALAAQRIVPKPAPAQPDVTLGPP